MVNVAIFFHISAFFILVLSKKPYIKKFCHEMQLRYLVLKIPQWMYEATIHFSVVIFPPNDTKLALSGSYLLTLIN